jgi:hypothetical protein
MPGKDHPHGRQDQRDHDDGHDRQQQHQQRRSVVQFDTPYGSQEITGLDKSAVERLLLRADCTGSFVIAFNVDASRSHATFKTPGSKTFVILFGGAATATFTAITTNYALNVGPDGSITGGFNWALSSGTAVAWT